MNFIPTNATEALRVARAEEKAKVIISEGYTFEKQEGTELIAVCKPGHSAAAYWIWDAPDGFWQGCNCPASVANGGNFCKHTLAYERLLEEEENLLKNAPTEDEEYGRAWYADRAALRA